MMGRKKTEAVEVLLNESGLAPTVTVDQYMAPYDVKIEQIMKDAEVNANSYLPNTVNDDCPKMDILAFAWCRRTD